MKHPMVIKMIMTRRRVTRQQVANKLGVKKADDVFDPVYTDTFYINRMVDILDALGYQLVFQPKGNGTLPEWSYPIRWSDYQRKE